MSALRMSHKKQALQISEQMRELMLEQKTSEAILAMQILTVETSVGMSEEVTLVEVIWTLAEISDHPNLFLYLVSINMYLLYPISIGL